MSEWGTYAVLKSENSRNTTCELMGGRIFFTEQEAWDALPNDEMGSFRIFKIELVGSKHKLRESDG